MTAPGSIDRPPGAKRHRLRVPVNGRQETVGWYDTREEAERAREAHGAVLVETAADYEGETLKKYAHHILTRREVKKLVRDPEAGWSIFRQHIEKDMLGGMALRAIANQPTHVFRWLKRLEDKNLEPQTRRNALVILRVIFREAHEEGKVKSNPCIGVRVKGKDKPAWTYLTREELPRMLAAFEDETERHIAAIAIGMGVRPGELVTLRREDVFLDDRPRVVIRYGSPPDKPTKTGAVRTVHLFGLALLAMRSWMAREPPNKNPHGLVFPRERGGFRDPNHLIRYEDWKAILKRAGITRRFRWYDFRHTCASWLVSGWWGRRWSLQEVKEMLGHTSITVTQRYAHLAASASEEAARLTPGDHHALSAPETNLPDHGRPQRQGEDRRRVSERTTGDPSGAPKRLAAGQPDASDDRSHLSRHGDPDRGDVPGEDGGSSVGELGGDEMGRVHEKNASMVASKIEVVSDSQRQPHDTAGSGDANSLENTVPDDGRPRQDSDLRTFGLGNPRHDPIPAENTSSALGLTEARCGADFDHACEGHGCPVHGFPEEPAPLPDADWVAVLTGMHVAREAAR